MINKIDFLSIVPNKFSQKPTKEKQYNQIAIKSGQVSQYASTPRLSVNYFIPFLGKKDYTEGDREFANLRRDLAKKHHKKMTAEELACWDFYINSTEENANKYNSAYEDSVKLSTDAEIYKKLKEIEKKGVFDPKLKKSFDNILKMYTESVPNAEAILELNDQQQKIAKKINEYRGMVDGETCSNAKLGKILETEKDVDIRKQAYCARKVNGGDLIASDLADLAKARNEYAKKLGYDNYFTYQLKEGYDVDEKQLFKLLDDLDKKTSKIYDKISEKEDKKLAEAFGINQKDLKPWHYGLLIDGSCSKEADSYIKDNDTMTSVAFDTYKKMGWDISKMPIFLDIFPRENKNQHGFCFDVDKNKDVRILANLTNNTSSLETLHHELGHAVYDVGISEHLPYFDRDPSSSAMTEAVAMLMQSLPQREGTFVEQLGMPEKLAKKLDDERKEDSIKFIRRSLLIINFEKELYKNPEQDLAKLWHNLDKKFTNAKEPDRVGNTWATIPHFLSHPAYYQNYLRAEMMACQIYDGASKKLGPLTKNEHTADFFKKKLFRHGASLNDNEIIKNISGKDLSVDAFCDQFKNMDFD